MQCLVPTRSAYRDLLRDLLGRPITARPAKPQRLDGDGPAYLAVYRFDDGRVAAASVMDRQLAFAVGGALGGLPPRATRLRVERSGEFDEELLDGLREVFNVATRLYNRPGGPHVVVHEVMTVPGQVPSDAAETVRSPRQRDDWLLEIQSYGRGVLTLFS